MIFYKLYNIYGVFQNNVTFHNNHTHNRQLQNKYLIGYFCVQHVHFFSPQTCLRVLAIKKLVPKDKLFVQNISKRVQCIMPFY